MIGLEEPFQVATSPNPFQCEVSWRTQLKGTRPWSLLAPGRIEPVSWQAWVDGAILHANVWASEGNMTLLKAASFDLEQQVGRILARMNDDLPVEPFPLGYPLGQILLAGLLSHGDGIIIHASGIKYAGLGLLFVGRAGSGKSTMARLWDASGVTVLGEERLALRKVRGSINVFGTPWQSDSRFARPSQAELAALFLLDHGADNVITRIPVAEAAKRILLQTFLPFWDANALQRCLGFVNSLVASIPCYELKFVPEPSVVAFLCSLVEQELSGAS